MSIYLLSYILWISIGQTKKQIKEFGVFNYLKAIADWLIETADESSAEPHQPKSAFDGFMNPVDLTSLDDKGFFVTQLKPLHILLKKYKFYKL